VSGYSGAVGFVGVGKMGLPMARRLRGAGFELVLADKTPDLVRASAAELQAKVAVSFSALQSVGLLICMLPDSGVVESVLEAPGGIFDVLRPGAIILDMGSSAPRRTQRLSEIAAAAGFEFADAPVSGGVARAVSGDLTIMFGGSGCLFERVKPVLAAMGSSVVHVGDVGAGHAMKALNNLLSATGLAAACEVIEAGRRFGLAPETMLDVLNGSTGRNNATDTKIAQFVLSESYSSGFGLRLMLKDLRAALELVRSVGSESILSDACLDLWSRAAEALPEDADHTMVARFIGLARF
jgi:3-hydroxyisobutyrate dehydrogenase